MPYPSAHGCDVRGRVLAETVHFCFRPEADACRFLKADIQSMNVRRAASVLLALLYCQLQKRTLIYQ